jgi:hypothetical protein
MGAYLYFKTENNPNEVDNFLQQMAENKKLVQKERGIFITCDEDIKWTKENRPDMLKIVESEYGTGSIKVSGIDNEEALLESYTKIFEELNKHFKMKYYVRSCAFNGYYFSLEQMKRITKNGELLSGKSKHPEEYEKLKVELLDLMEVA